MGRVTERIKELREQKYTLQQIGNMVGRSRQYVSQVLRAAGYMGRTEYPELYNPQTYENKTDGMIALEYGVSVNRVIGARRSLNIKKRREVDMKLRRRSLAHNVFGCSPGPNFPLIADFIRETLPDGQADRMIKFYVEGEAGRDDYSRVRRVQANRMLREYVNDEVVKRLEQAGVLVAYQCEVGHE